MMLGMKKAPQGYGNYPWNLKLIVLRFCCYKTLGSQERNSFPQGSVICFHQSILFSTWKEKTTCYFASASLTFNLQLHYQKKHDQLACSNKSLNYNTLNLMSWFLWAIKLWLKETTKSCHQSRNGLDSYLSCIIHMGEYILTSQKKSAEIWELNKILSIWAFGG